MQFPELFVSLVDPIRTCREFHLNNFGARTIDKRCHTIEPVYQEDRSIRVTDADGMALFKSEKRKVFNRCFIGLCHMV